MANSRPLSQSGQTVENRDGAASPRVSWKERISTTIPRSSTVDSASTYQSTYQSTAEDVYDENEGVQKPQRKYPTGIESKPRDPPRSTLVTDSPWTQQYVLSLGKH